MTNVFMRVTKLNSRKLYVEIYLYSKYLLHKFIIDNNNTISYKMSNYKYFLIHLY